MKHPSPIKPIYVWQLPVRFFHMINALAILVLMITGVYIGNPFVSPQAFSATPAFLMGYVREIHFIAGYIFAANLMLRLYWAFAGNKNSRINVLKKSFWTGKFQMLKYYLFIDRKHPHYLGHNPMAEFGYLTCIGLGGIILCLTGFFMLFEIRPHSTAFAMFSWMMVFSENSIWMHYIHHWLAWGIMVFIVIHVYMAVRVDALDKDGALTSIFTGYKFTHDEDEEHAAKAKGKGEIAS
ncbi:Ni/Fe-hydrogenase, b-type cytochrome subunit [Brevibacillus sp. SYSU BS000544]|uniref:Ni/Fe-hydrogenase, b-type cytochrome subunit n=1 Tax=Brevibacillus sp. SYSU BS000544 TaxID=3416443 RepID=UPI003CE4F6E4